MKMSKFRVYRILSKVQYKDVEENNKKDALKHFIDSENSGWITISQDCITGSCVTQNFEEILHQPYQIKEKEIEKN